MSSTVFVAHARGAIALLRWLNTLPKDTKVKKIITISCNYDFQPGRTDGDEFYTTKLDYEDIMKKCQQTVVIHSEDDPYVNIAAGEQLAENLGAKLVRYESAGHFGSDKLDAPEILREI
jgi:predicted alpha/beta hydrolase family esterase